MNRQADIGCVSAHFDGQSHFGDQIAGAGADDSGAENAVRLLVEQQLGEAIIAVQRQRAPAGRPREGSLAVLDAARFRLGLG